jgi:hypothetical protein
MYVRARAFSYLIHPATIGAGPAVIASKRKAGRRRKPTVGKVYADVSADVCAAINMAGFLISKLTSWLSYLIS